MTIKQQGGVFGRNPTFNNVEADGKLTTLGRLGVGTVDPAYDVDITSGAPSLVLRDTDANSGLHWLRVSNNKFIIGADFANSATNSDIWLQVDGGTKMVVASTGDVTVSNGNLVIGTSGKGIDFSATSGTGTSELFDDYEEGTWTPVFQGSTSGSKDLGAIGKYTKIGRMVHVAFYATNADFSSAAIVGTVELSGLPFNVATLGYGLGNIAINNLVTGGSDYVPYPYTADKLRFSAGSTAQLSDTGLTQSASRYIAIALTYEAA